MASSVSKNLYKSLQISNQIECPESGMSRSNSKKSHVDVQTLELSSKNQLNPIFNNRAKSLNIELKSIKIELKLF